MSQLEDDAYALKWNNNISVATITLVSYEYILQFEKEVKFVWGRQWSPMTYLYLVVRYFGVFIAMTYACWGGLFYIPEAVSHGIFLLMQWGISLYFCLAEVILIWRLYVLYNQSKPVLYVLLGFFIPVIALYIAMDIFLWSRPSAISTEEVMITSNIKYCTTSFHIGPMPAIYASIPIICYDIFLVILAIAVLKKHLRERKELKMRPNTYVIMIVQHHIIYFVLNLACQIFMAILWANLPTVASIWDTHANESCVHVSTTFEDCVCWTSPPVFDQHETGSCA
ncbi:hypothetical protein DEU56DRAFT_470314 [Suillus clintonianus]|uniref:uncharacterized protein n=1 Tax=Suillus clintonianus TaxID=1904413 RepID=UPI001B86971A|nr:uncharacterized protein DEU56DRAFT_470314 [Suillus clintonianus]KAG2153151.1 hypothetical protein DEU56DRAFT_470314 [Suillus clintonianus]